MRDLHEVSHRHQGPFPALLPPRGVLTALAHLFPASITRRHINPNGGESLGCEPRVVVSCRGWSPQSVKKAGACAVDSRTFGKREESNEDRSGGCGVLVWCWFWREVDG
jgi:hypothetical protein